MLSILYLISLKGKDSKIHQYRDESNLPLFIKFRSFKIVVCSRENLIKNRRNVSNSFKFFVCFCGDIFFKNRKTKQIP